MTKTRLEKVNQVLSFRQPDLTVIMDGVHKSHNVAAIVRSCEAFGVQDVYMVKPRVGFSTHHGTTQGSHKWVTKHHYETAKEAIRALKNRGFQVLAANQSESSQIYYQVDFTRPTAILMGTELFGVSSEGLALADQDIYIPMVGMVESLNVSVACAVILAEAQRQRMSAGMYGENQLSLAHIKQLRFEWLQPEVARHYRNKGEPYPELDDDGDIICG